MTRQEMYALIEQHYRENRTRLVRRLYRSAGGSANAQDVVQEAYTRACQYWASFYDNDETFDSWLNGIIRNALIRQRTKDSQRQENDVEMLQVPSMRNVEIERAMLREIAEKIEEKKPNVARILKLYMFGQYTPREIVEIVPETGNNIRIIVHRFREELKNVYKRNNDTSGPSVGMEVRVSEGV